MYYSDSRSTASSVEDDMMLDALDSDDGISTASKGIAINGKGIPPRLHKNELSMSVPGIGGTWDTKKKAPKVKVMANKQSPLEKSGTTLNLTQSGFVSKPKALEVEDMSDEKLNKRKTISVPLHTEVYLNSMVNVFGLHSYELDEGFHLSILTSGEELSDTEKEQLWNVRKEIKMGLQGGLLQFMKILKSTHLESIKLNYIHQLPGLVHFMYVERNSDRLYAPKISSLVGQNFECAGSPGFKADCKEYLRGRVSKYNTNHK